MTKCFPVVTINGERVVYHNIALTFQYALLTGWCVMALRDIHCYYLREIVRDTFRGSFQRIGQHAAARAMDFRNDCQVLDFRREQA